MFSSCLVPSSLTLFSQVRMECTIQVGGGLLPQVDAFKYVRILYMSGVEQREKLRVG